MPITGGDPAGDFIQTPVDVLKASGVAFSVHVAGRAALLSAASWCAQRLQQPAASGAPETQDNVAQVDIARLSTDPYDVEDPDQLRILVEVEAQDAAARPEHGLTEARIISRRPDHRIPGLHG
jgi:hypothetical protein